MKITLYKILEKINQALNYPSISYEDISYFFDVAIADLNSTLHTSIKPVSVLIEEYREDIDEERKDWTVRVKSSVIENQITILEDEPEFETGPEFYFNKEKQLYGIKKAENYEYNSAIYALDIDNNKRYVSWKEYSDKCIWAEDIGADFMNLNMALFFPADWIILWMIPYLCFKYSVRDGGSAETFSNEYSQGFMQLQNAYDIKEKTRLCEVQNEYAYARDVKEHEPYLNVEVPTRAIYESMKHNRAVMPKYGGFHENGGWGNNFFDDGWQW